jgi:hypothetical protein
VCSPPVHGEVQHLVGRVRMELLKYVRLLVCRYACAGNNTFDVTVPRKTGQAVSFRADKKRCTIRPGDKDEAGPHANSPVPRGRAQSRPRRGKCGDSGWRGSKLKVDELGDLREMQHGDDKKNRDGDRPS